MRNKKWKIGGSSSPTPEEVPFPVVNLRISPLADKEKHLCAGRACDTKGIFLVQSCLDLVAPQRLDLMPTFSKKEKGELLWEKAYREQKAGKEPDYPCFPLCLACAVTLAEDFMGGEHYRKEVTMRLLVAEATSMVVILFDRNLMRTMEHPAIALGLFDTLAEFRAHYSKAFQSGTLPTS